MSYQSDRDVFWIVSLAWFEQRQPYDAPATSDPSHKPLLHYGRILKYETRAEAEAAAERLRERPELWAPRHAIEPTVSDPTHVARRTREAA